jgi:hypothetical protein
MLEALYHVLKRIALHCWKHCTVRLDALYHAVESIVQYCENLCTMLFVKQCHAAKSIVQCCQNSVEHTVRRNEVYWSINVVTWSAEFWYTAMASYPNGGRCRDTMLCLSCTACSQLHRELSNGFLHHVYSSQNIVWWNNLRCLDVVKMLVQVTKYDFVMLAPYCCDVVGIRLQYRIDAAWCHFGSNMMRPACSPPGSSFRHHVLKLSSCVHALASSLSTTLHHPGENTRTRCSTRVKACSIVFIVVSQGL